MKIMTVLAFFLVGGCDHPRVGGPMQGGPSEKGFYESAIQPVLTQYCVECHSGPEAPNGLVLTSYEKVFQGAPEGSGAIVVPGQPDSSLLIRRVKGLGVARMPKGKAPLADTLITRIELWINEGALKD